MKKTTIICGFPGVGKSYLFNNTNLDCIDSDSSKFDKKHFPDNYIKHIEKNIGKVDYIFVSTHSEVLYRLNNMCEFHVVYPNRELKEEYLQRYRDRGNEESFINLIDNMWDKFIDDIENIPSTFYHRCMRYRLKSGEFLKDYLGLQ